MLSSASGMPQHWQINSLGEPSNVLMDTSNSFDNRFNVSVFGIVSPLSQRDTACLVTNILSASSSCESPAFVRSCNKISFVSMLFVSIAFTTFPPVYSNRRLGASNAQLPRRDCPTPCPPLSFCSSALRPIRFSAYICRTADKFCCP